MSNSLTIAALDNRSVTVPIGKTVLTNKKINNSRNVQAAMTGTEIDSPKLETIDAPGYDGKQAYRTNEDEVYFGSPIDRTALQVAEASFDKDTGVFTIVRKDRSKLQITSLLRQIDFGSGPQGSRGDDGTDGTDGDDAKDGKDGDTGCAGPNGAEGRNGPVGDPGLEGDVGPNGAVGALGPTGPRGDSGGQGPGGFEGKRGLCGYTCPTTMRGPCGAQGNTMNANVATGLYPTNLDLIWAADEDCVSPNNPAKIPAVPTYVPVEFQY